MSLKSWVVEECEKIPSDDRILEGSFDMVHEIKDRITFREKTGKIIDNKSFKEHIITIKWVETKNEYVW